MIMMMTMMMNSVAAAASCGGCVHSRLNATASS